MVGVIELETGGGVDRKTRFNAAAVEVDAVGDLCRILRDRIILRSLKLKRKAGVVGKSRGKPHARRNAILEALAESVALVLGIRKVARQLRGGVGNVVPKKLAAGYGKPDV